MDVKGETLFTQVRPQSWPGKIIQFPLVRMLVVFVFLAPILILSNLTVIHVIRQVAEPYASVLRYVRDILTFILIVLAYRYYARIVERRDAYELGYKGSLGEFGVGALISLAIVGIMVGLMASLGYYRIDHLNSPYVLLMFLFRFGMASFIEELLFRGIFFKLMEELCGSWIAMLATGVLFGFAHVANPNATVWTSLGLVLSDTILFAAAYMLTRRIWLVWGLHLSWNYFQTAVFGMPNSGVAHNGWITPAIGGPDWMTGGSFGIEASYVQILISFIVGLWVLRRAIAHDQTIQPVWRRGARRGTGGER